METLAKLFGSENKVKIMRLFLFNPDKVFSIKDIAERIKAKSFKVRKEITVLEHMGLIKHRTLPKNKKGSMGFCLDSSFTYLKALYDFLINTPLQSKEITKKLTRLGSIKLIVISGVFIQESDSRVDIMIIGDGVKAPSLQNTMKSLESEIGRELKFAYFTTEDFKYRLTMYDKLIRDVLDYPHEKVVNKLGIE